MFYVFELKFLSAVSKNKVVIFIHIPEKKRPTIEAVFFSCEHILNNSKSLNLIL
jgi:hypothetical protein